ncbi:glycosyltransferase family 2 protein [Geodermatophilus maliterrae]|uniref:Glycosyltransferase family 2 protein n=1 Tax=Geodermatophilus maliterrae TaxID=3162531 RepID=A0ABV3XC70_9ACTN
MTESHTPGSHTPGSHTPGSRTPRFSLVVPCYNEAASLPELVLRARFTAEAGDGEVVLVDNGSTDDTPEVLARLLDPADDRVRSIRVDPNRGYGWGITSGLAATRAPIVGWTHADLQTDPADALRAVAAMEGAGRVLVKGRRYGRPLADRVFTAGMSVFETVLLRRRLSDINAQPTMFPRELMDSWGDPPLDFSLDLFALYTAAERGYEIRRVPVVFAPRRFGTSSWNVDLAAKRRFIKRTVDFSLALRKQL